MAIATTEQIIAYDVIFVKFKISRRDNFLSDDIPNQTNTDSNINKNITLIIGNLLP